MISFNLENANSYEKWIDKARISKCYIEALVLIHNTIEVYLAVKIKNFIMYEEDKKSEDKEELLFSYGKKFIYYAEISYLLAIISKSDYEKLLEFNKKRNIAVHKLLRNEIKYEDLKEFCKFGYELQLKLSPLGHSDEDIKNILKKWDE